MSHLDDLTASELAMLGHALRMVPNNACLAGPSAERLASNAHIAFFHEIPAFKSLWKKIALAIREREDMAEFRKEAVAK